MPCSRRRLLDLERRLGQVGVQRHVELAGQLGARPEDLLGARVRRVRRDRRNDQRMPLPAGDELARARQRVLEARGVGRRELEHRLRAQRAQAGRRRGFGDRFLEVVHVGEAGRARPDHLRAGERRAERDEIGPDERPLDRHHVAHQPDVEAEIVGEPAQQRHRRVRVRVHEPRHDDAPAAVDGLGRRRTRCRRRRPRESCRRAMATDPGACTVNCSSIVRTCALVSRRSQGVRITERPPIVARSWPADVARPPAPRR